MNYTYIDIDSNVNNGYVVKDFIERNLKKFGMSLNFFCDIAFSTDTIKKILGVCPNDLIIVRLSNDYDKNIELKNTLCECFNSFLVKNTACSFAIESYLRLYNGVIDNPMNFENESLIPDGAEPLTSDFGFVQGYMLNLKNLNFIFLPPELSQIKDILDNKLPSMFSRLYKTPTEFIYLKTFGLSEDNLNKILLPFINNSMNVLVNFSVDSLDSLISIGYNLNINSNELDQFVAQLCESLKKHLYATEDISIEKMALDLISLTNKRVSILESITRGKMYYRLSNTDNNCVKKCIVDHRVISEVSDLYTLETINRNAISQKGMYSVESAYEITTTIINELGVNLAVSSIGEYDEATKSLNCFLAVGDLDGVHIYKSSYRGEIDDLQDLIIKNTCFYIIRKLKQNDLLFDHTL